MTIVAGNTTAIVPAIVRDDPIVEGTEYFNVTIDPSSLPNNIALGDPSEAKVTIYDDDSK